LQKNNESDLREIEPGLRACRPVTCLTPGDRRCVHAYYTMSPLSRDNSKLTYFEFDDLHPDRRSGRPIGGRVMVANADGSGTRPIVRTAGASVCQGAMQQWVGAAHRVGFVDYSKPQWTVVDICSGERWQGTAQAREFAPEGTDLFIQTPENIHLVAQEQGRTLAPGDVACRIIDYRTGEEKARISVADVLAVHPETEEARYQHMAFKQTLFSPDGKLISFNFSNAFYSGQRPKEKRRHEKWIADRDGTNLRWLGPGATHPSWHPTSRYYFAVAPDAEGKRSFMLYPVDGSAPERIGPDWHGAGHPSFQPGEGRLLAVDLRKDKEGCVVLRLHDTVALSYEDILVAESADYSNQSGTHFHPAWSHDGRSIFIASAHSGVGRLYRIDL